MGPGTHHTPEAKAKISASKKKGVYRNPTWRSWRSMVERCQEPHNASYPRYGGIGVTVCERWLKLENFIADMGLRPEGEMPSGRGIYSIDRIDGTKGYEPGNCRWATAKEQAANRKSRK